MANVETTITGGIAHVKLNRPEKLNGVTLPMLGELVAAAHHVRRNKGVRAVVISGEGRSFCAGLDFGEVMAKPAKIVPVFLPRPWRGTNTFQEACWAWRRVPVPVIVAVHGHCYGGGLQIALAGDYRYTTSDAQWAVLEGKWGLIPDMSSVQSLKELVGIDVAKKLTMTAEMLFGERAVELGLASEVADDPLAAAGLPVDFVPSRRPSADQDSTNPPALLVRASTRRPVNTIGASSTGFGSSTAPTVTLAVTVEDRPNTVCT